MSNTCIPWHLRAGSARCNVVRERPNSAHQDVGRENATLQDDWTPGSESTNGGNTLEQPIGRIDGCPSTCPKEAETRFP